MSEEWIDAQEMSKRLIADGWSSPNTYSNYFEPLIDSSAVYLFLLHKTYDYKEAIVAYVGMSSCLTQRISGHNILPELNVPGFWPMIWFKPVPEPDLRSVEARYITSFNPPWNIQGRRRGVPLQ